MKNVILGIIAIVIIGGGYYGYTMWNTYAPENYVQENGTVVNAKTDTIIATTTPTFSLADVSSHKDASSCYSIIQGKVYDLTLWVNAHPGGSKAILSLCGIDGTSKFIGKHKGEQKFMDILKRFYIGDLK